MIKKLLYPSFWDTLPIEVFIVEMNEDGEEVVSSSWAGKCNFSETNKRIQNDKGLWVHLSGVVHIKGDIFPEKSVISGYVVFNGRKITISNASRPRNPDGSVNHTRLELL